MQFNIPDLLNPALPPTPEIFDVLHDRLSSSNHHEIGAIQEALCAFQTSPQSFSLAYDMLTKSTNLQTRFFALRIIDDAIRFRWNSLQNEERDGLKNVLGSSIIQECQTPQRWHAQKPLVMKMNAVLVSIAKHEYPYRWPSFVSDIVSMANPSQPATVENSISILGILGEEVFAFGERTMTKKWVEKKRAALKTDFELIYMFAMQVLEKATDASLVTLTLQTIEKYLHFVDPELVFRDDILSYVSSLVQHAPLRDASIEFLTEVLSIAPTSNSVFEARQRATVSAIFNSVLPSVINDLPTQHSELANRIASVFSKGRNSGRDFVRTFCIFLVTIHKNYFKAIAHNTSLVLAAHQMLVGITHVPDKEILKICIDYWRWLGLRLNRARTGGPSEDGDLGRQFFRTVQALLSEELKNVRFALIRHMPKPEEVVIVENENGEVVSITMQDVEALEMYADVREALWFFTRLDPADTVNILVALMARQRDMSEWSFRNINTLCWSVGSVAGALDQKRERELFITIIRELLTMCSEMRETKNRAVIASNIMYIVGQYDAFLLAHESFFKTVCNRLFYFMKETFEGVQDMAVDTLLKLSKRVPKCFLSMDDRRIPFIQTVIENYADHISLLNFSQVQTFFEAIGHAIRAISDPQFQTSCLTELLAYTDERLSESASVAQRNVELSCTIDHLKELIHLLRLHSSVAKSCGPCYFSEINKMFDVFKGYYVHYFNAINQRIGEMGPDAVNHQQVRYMRIVKKEVLQIFEYFTTDTNDIEFVSNVCMPQILELILSDYRDSLPAARDAQVLAFVAACVKKLTGTMNQYVAGILNCCFEPTAQLIISNHYDMPDHRTNLYLLLNELCVHCFEAFLNYASNNTAIVESLLFAIQHTDSIVQLTSLETLSVFIMNVSQSNMADSFFSAYMENLLTKVMIVTMDKLHAGALQQQAHLLELLFNFCRSRPWDMPAAGGAAVTNIMTSCLSQIATLEPQQINAFIGYCIGPNAVSGPSFVQMIHDFLIEMDVWGSAQENAAIDAAEKAQLAMEMPGIQQPSYVPSYQAMAQRESEMMK